MVGFQDLTSKESGIVLFATHFAGLIVTRRCTKALKSCRIPRLVTRRFLISRQD